MLNVEHDYRHLKKMTDATGMLQFSQGARPDPTSGYTLDDNARALLVSAQMPIEAQGYCGRFLDYLRASYQPDGSWSNLLLNGEYSEHLNSNDSLGRLVLAFSAASRFPWPELRTEGTQLLSIVLPQLNEQSSIRSQAYTLLALAHGSNDLLPYDERLRMISRFASSLLRYYWQTHGHDWYWFEDGMYYCNGVLPQSLFAAYGVTGDPSCLRAAIESLDFLNAILFREGYLNVIGNQGWYLRGKEPALYDQQPVDAASTCFANLEAWRLTARSEYRQLAEQAAAWFRGDNRQRLNMIDPASGGCYDAITEHGVNLNQGAESLLSWLLIKQAMKLLKQLPDNGPDKAGQWDQLCGVTT